MVTPSQTQNSSSSEQFSAVGRCSGVLFHSGNARNCDLNDLQPSTRVGPPITQVTQREFFHDAPGDQPPGHGVTGSNDRKDLPSLECGVHLLCATTPLGTVNAGYCRQNGRVAVKIIHLLFPKLWAGIRGRTFNHGLAGPGSPEIGNADVGGGCIEIPFEYCGQK